MKKNNNTSGKYNGGISNQTFLIIVIVVIALAIISAIVLPKILTNNEEQIIEGEKNNYTVQADGSKLNNSKDVSKTQNVGQIVIEKSSIVYQNGITKLTSKVTNNGPTQENLIFLIKFLADDGTVIAESKGLVGQISTGGVRYIDSNITIDTSNAKSITYEIDR